MKVISNKGWLHKGRQAEQYGEQPIDVAYTVLALDRFYKYLERIVCGKAAAGSELVPGR